MGDRPVQEIKQLGQCLKLTRQLHQRTQASLAEVLSTSPQQIQKYERGLNRIPADAILRFALELQISVTSFFPGEVSDCLQDMEVSDDGFALLKQFMSLDEKKRSLVMDLVSHLGDSEIIAAQSTSGSHANEVGEIA